MNAPTNSYSLSRNYVTSEEAGFPQSLRDADEDGWETRSWTGRRCETYTGYCYGHAHRRRSIFLIPRISIPFQNQNQNQHEALWPGPGRFARPVPRRVRRVRAVCTSTAYQFGRTMLIARSPREPERSQGLSQGLREIPPEAISGYNLCEVSITCLGGNVWKWKETARRSETATATFNQSDN